MASVVWVSSGKGTVITTGAHTSDPGWDRRSQACNLGERMLERQEFKANLSYSVSSSPALAT